MTTTPLPPAAVSVDNDVITVDAEALAPRLGLTVDALKENMANGLVTSVAEAGMAEDAGCTRLTFRYRARVWRIVVSADGTLREDPVDPPDPAGPNAAKRLSRLADLASSGS